MQNGLAEGFAQALEWARKSRPAPNSICALEGCDKPLPDVYGFVLWADHPEDDRYCSKHHANLQFNRLLPMPLNRKDEQE